MTLVRGVFRSWARSLLRLFCGPGVPQGSLPGRVQLDFHFSQTSRKMDRLLPRLGQLFRRPCHGLHLLYGPGDKEVADDDPAQQDHQDTHQEEVLLHPVHQGIEGVARIPGDAVAHLISQEGHRQHHGDPGHQGQQVEAPGPQRPAAAPVR